MRDEMDCDVEMRLVSGAKPEVEQDERRSDERVDPGDARAALWLKAHDKTWPLRSVRVLDIGPGGLSFESDAPLPIGAVLEMNINMPVRNGISAVAEVCYAIQWASSYRVGVKFVQMSEADRSLFDSRNLRIATVPRMRRALRRHSGQARGWEDETV
jgi:hypothetical protein